MILVIYLESVILLLIVDFILNKNIIMRCQIVLLKAFLDLILPVQVLEWSLHQITTFIDIFGHDISVSHWLLIEKHLLIQLIESVLLIRRFFINLKVAWGWIILQLEVFLKFEILRFWLNWFLDFKNNIDILSMAILIVNMA